MSTTLRHETMELPVAAVGAEGPFPPLEPEKVPHQPPDRTTVPADIADRVEAAAPPWVFPYHPQSDYGRDRTPGRLDVVVLENAHLRATVVPGLGGRIWSLVDVPTGADLVYANRVLQPANLALRDAWFAGGVEFNVGTRGHSPTTCSPLHAAVVAGPDGAPGLRMWEYERVRGVVVQIDVHLGHDATMLAVHVRVTNPGDVPVPMYWWTNIAVPEEDDTRVFAAARDVYLSDYTTGLTGITAPWRGDVDITRPGRHADAADYFVDCRGVDVPWVLAVDPAGTGLLHASTPRLSACKLFCWGSGRGSRHWQEWLSPEGGRYAEIQAGLATTQFEYLELGAREEWSWTEVLGRVDLGPVPATTGPEDGLARAGAAASARVPAADLAALDAELARVARQAPGETVAVGSGWGHVEALLRGPAGWVDETATPFPDVADGPHRPWQGLVTDGTAPADVDARAHVRGGHWADLLADAAHDGDAFALYHLGVLELVDGDPDTAGRHLRASLDAAPSAAAHRALAHVALRRGDTDAAVRELDAALALAGPGSVERPALVLEALRRLLDSGRHDRALQLARAASAEPPAQATASERARFRLAEVEALLGLDDRASARHVLETGDVVPANLREGESLVAALWERAAGGAALPERLDFSMHGSSEGRAAVS
ncbi:DUF5107 domain-containing protein [Isoptericola sp. NPDC057559]|uniref:DUF5107 domain-containing protein n=1 Tax=Isoptericola sp. NPDC057559 TaxID=3346168 RepID=UPI00369D9401